MYCYSRLLSNAMRRIVVIHHSGIIGGAGVSLMNTVRILSKSNDVTVFISNDPQDMLHELEAIQKDFRFEIASYGHRIGALTYYSGGDRLFSARFLYRAFLILCQWRYWNRLLRKLDPDIVIVNSMILSWMGLIPEIKKRRSICFVRETINGKLQKRINQIIRNLLLHFNKVVFLSEYDQSSWDFPKANSLVIRNFIEPDVLNTTISRDVASSNFGLRRESFHLLYVGGVSYMKGFDLVVKATLECDSDAELLIAGVDFNDRRKLSGGRLSQYETQIFEYIRQNDKLHRVHFVGRQMNMSLCYSSADVLVFPMRSPHQARPVFEAGWYSIPVIITDFENIREDVQDGDNGLLTHPDSIVSLVESIDYLNSHPIERKILGNNNNRRTHANHSKEKNNQQILNLIERLR